MSEHRNNIKGLLIVNWISTDARIVGWCQLSHAWVAAILNKHFKVGSGNNQEYSAGTVQRICSRLGLRKAARVYRYESTYDTVNRFVTLEEALKAPKEELFKGRPQKHRLSRARDLSTDPILRQPNR